MKILSSIHLYPWYHLCGAEWMLHHIHKFLQSRGHQIRVMLHQADMHGIRTPYEFDGIDVMKPNGTVDQIRWADVLFTHLDFSQWTIQMGNVLSIPVVNFIHNTHPYNSIRNAVSENYVVYNSEWSKGTLNYQWPSIVFPPPCDYRYYDVCENPETSEFITLISLNKNKGGEQFYEIAKRLPDKKFLGVQGSYDPQIYNQLPNVTLLGKQVEIRDIYKQTRILLMPSEYESWGRTATEAMCSGIPVICSPTPGLKENCGAAGLFADRDDIDKWVKIIKRLDDPIYYKTKSDLSRKRSRELDPTNNYYEFENFLYMAVKKQLKVA